MLRALLFFFFFLKEPVVVVGVVVVVFQGLERRNQRESDTPRAPGFTQTPH